MEIDGNDSLSIEHEEEIHIFHKSMDLLTSSILNNNLEDFYSELCGVEVQLFESQTCCNLGSTCRRGVCDVTGDKTIMQFPGLNVPSRSVAYNFLNCLIHQLTPWLMEPGGSMPHSQVISNNPYPEPNQSNLSYPHLFL